MPVPPRDAGRIARTAHSDQAKLGTKIDNLSIVTEKRISPLIHDYGHLTRKYSPIKTAH
ncbi:MAG: hypothetical protein IPM55_22905 [Acidobacteria bacterium]|nr:hypothetical protein [Acidobacteriota bacterium]